MHITVRTVVGRSIRLDVEPSDLVQNVMDKIEEKEGIPVVEMRLLFAGKQLTRGLTLGDYNIENGYTLHLIRRLLPNVPATHNVPNESVFPTKDEANMKVEEWRALATKGDFDADIHILDPQAYYTTLDSLERQVLERSHFFLRRDDSTSPRLKIAVIQALEHMSTAPRWIKGLAAEFAADEDMIAHSTTASLCEIYQILLRVIESFDMLKEKHFCQDFFSILIERVEGTVAELVRIGRPGLAEFQEMLEVAITVAQNQEMDMLGGDLEELKECVMATVESILAVLGYSQLAYAISNTYQAVDLCRGIVCLLDLGMVSYAGSHASAFDVMATDRNMNSVTLTLETGLAFDCSRRQLACLNGFLDAKSAWVFRIIESALPTTTPVGGNKKLSILTHIDTLADIWGPVWAELDDTTTIGENRMVKKYHVSKGCIRRVRQGTASEIPGAILCHWYSWAQDYVRRFSSLITRTEALPMNLNDKLLIGAELRVNPNCNYTLREYEMNYGDMMGPLGPGPSTWKLDGATVGVQVAAPKVVAFQIQGNVKKVPETTVKEFIMDRWRFEPERANPGVLNSYYGLEISHCTGNARRVPLKYILLMPSVEDLLERQIPGWSDTEWGKAFVRALQTESNSAIFKFWNDFKHRRPLVGQLVRSVLDVLDSTGKQEGKLRAAFIHQNTELGIDIDEHNNEWINLLKDSYLMATYAIVSDRCLECRRPDHSASICNDESRYTVLQSQIGLKRGDELKERVKIEPQSQTFKRIDNERVARGNPYFLTPEISLKRAFLGSYNLAIAKELSEQSEDPPGNTTKVLIRAAGRGFGGMEYERDRTLLTAFRGLDLEEQTNFEDLTDQDMLTQFEIESILNNAKEQQIQDKEDLLCQTEQT